MKNTEWAKSLKYARVDAGLTQRELASKIGVTQSIVSAWERGAFGPSPKALQRLSEILDIPTPGVIAPGHLQLQKLLGKVATMNEDEVSQMLLMADAIIKRRSEDD